MTAGASTGCMTISPLLAEVVEAMVFNDGIEEKPAA